MMKNYINFIREQKEDNHLIVVDVQKEFSKFMPTGYADAILKYCENFNNVYQIWDSNDATEPSYTFPNQKEAIVKKFGTKFSDELVETVKKLNEKYPTAKEGDIFEFDDIDSYVVKVINNHGWFYVTEKMSKLFKALKGKSVVIIGGASKECLLDVYIAMKAFGINVNYDKRYIYSAKTNDSQVYDINMQEKII